MAQHTHLRAADRPPFTLIFPSKFLDNTRGRWTSLDEVALAMSGQKLIDDLLVTWFAAFYQGF